MTHRDLLVLKTEKIFEIEDPQQNKLSKGKVIPAREIEDLKQFMSEVEL